MFKVFMSTINELTDRGLCHEAAELHHVFIKLAALTEHKVRSALKLANPDKNSSEHERHNAASRVIGWLRDKEKSSFTNNELANYIIQDEFYTFPAQNALGSLLTPDEIQVLNQLITQKLDAKKEDEIKEDDPRPEQPKTYTGVQEVEYIIDTILKVDPGNKPAQRLVSLAGFSGEYSDAYIVSKVGSVVSFIVPVSGVGLGFKEFTLEELADMGMVYNAATRKVFFG
jgi:hypothetical protein